MMTSSEYEYGYSLMQRMGGKNSIANVAVSDYMKDYMQRLKIPCSRVIQHGVDVDFWKPLDKKEELRKKWGIPNDKKVAICVTKFHPLKYHLIPQLVKDFP